MDFYKHVILYDFIGLHMTHKSTINTQIINTFKRQQTCPLFLLSDDQSESDMITFLEAGADGYLELDSDVRLLKTSIECLIKYVKSLKLNFDQKLKIGKFDFLLDRYEIRNGSEVIKLTKNDYKILLYLYENRNRVVSKDDIINKLWNEDDSASNNALSIRILRLRKKIRDEEENMIQTVWGVGYILKVSES